MCIDDQDLSAYIDKELTTSQMLSIKEHLKICDNCRKRVHTLKMLRNKLKTFGVESDQFVKENVWTRLVHSTSANKELDFWHRRFILPPSLVVGYSFAFLAVIGIGLLLLIPDKNKTNYVVNNFETQFDSEKFPVEIPIDNIETILAYFDIHDEPLEVSIQLPDASSFIIQGEPRFLRKADYIAGR